MTTRVALVEVPAVDVELDGERILDDFTLNHPKYAQQVLAANLRAAASLDVEVELVDLKAGTGGGAEAARVPYGRFDYCGHRIDVTRVGVPFEAVDHLRDADVVGISANFTMERAVVAQTIEYLRGGARLPLIVVGGHDATADPEYYLERGADLCVLGEGEDAIVEIARAVADGRDPCVGGTASRHGGGIRRDTRRRPESYERVAFPDADLLRTSKFDQSPDGPLPPGARPPIAAFETSRGCPEACSFCDISYVVGRYRAMPLALLEERVRAFKAAGIRTIQIIDDNLLYRTLPAYEGERGREVVIELFRMLRAEGFAWEFFNGFQLGLFERGGRIDVELIEAVYNHHLDGDRIVGCFRSYVPLDKVVDGEISLLRKLKPLHVTEQVVEAIGGCGVPALALGVVVGTTRDTPRTFDETAATMTRIAERVARASGGRSSVMVLPLCSVPLPGTPDFRTFDTDIAYRADDHPELYNVFMSVLRTADFTPLEITRQRQRLRMMIGS